eukprot:1140963-Pelagomonas_calceolata.AAC.2
MAVTLTISAFPVLQGSAEARLLRDATIENDYEPVQAILAEQEKGILSPAGISRSSSATGWNNRNDYEPIQAVLAEQEKGILSPAGIDWSLSARELTEARLLGNQEDDEMMISQSCRNQLSLATSKACI